MPMTILALLPEAVTARRCLDIAWAAASAVNAAMEAFHVKVDPAKVWTSDEERALQGLRAHREGTAEARAAAVRSIYAAWREQLRPDAAERVTWREVVGAEEASVAKETRHADLVVLPRPHNLDGGDANHAAFRMSHRPLLFVPDSTCPPGAGFARHILIAWKPTPQAQRAVEGAAVWLRQAERVSAVMVAPDLEHAGWEDLERLMRQLGFAAEPILVAPTAGEVGAQILESVHGLRADAVVLGAYRHVDVVEWVLPSTTRYMLAHADLPLFMAH
jgi:nucleotide-binding universal stress UspA family protein